MARYNFDSSFEALFVNTCQQSVSMAQAAIVLKMNCKTVCFHAKRLHCFKPNQSGKSLSKKPSKQAMPLEEIFAGRHLTYQSHKLKMRLLSEGYKQHKCERCSLERWLEKPIALELHYIDGNRSNNELQNLKFLCPNCHAQTPNYRAKNIRNLSARLETPGVEPLKFGEALIEKNLSIGNPEPSFSNAGKGVET
jgi:5-methylcytosine-specific restriction endonuclease McrA